MDRYMMVTCPECDGEGVYVVGNGHWADGSENNYEVTCEACGGEGIIDVPSELIEFEDLDQC